MPAEGTEPLQLLVGHCDLAKPLVLWLKATIEFRHMQISIITISAEL